MRSLPFLLLAAIAFAPVGARSTPVVTDHITVNNYSTVSTTNVEAIDGNLSFTPDHDTDFQVAQLTSITNLLGTAMARECDGMIGIFNLVNTNIGNRCAAILAHVKTERGTDATANELYGIRTSLDHLSNAVLNRMIAIYIPQVDAENADIREVYGLYVKTLSGPHKPKVFAIKTDGVSDKVSFAGPTEAGSLVVGGGTKVSRFTYGTATLAAGTATVSLATVSPNTVITLTGNADGGVVGTPRVSGRTAGTSFTITSSSPLDTSTVGYVAVEP